MEVRPSADSVGVPRQLALSPRPRRERDTRRRRECEENDRMVSQMLADSRQVRVDLNPKAPESSRRAGTRSEEHRRASVSACREDDVFSDERFASGQPNAYGSPLEQKGPIDQDRGADCEIRASPRRGEIRQCCALPQVIEQGEHDIGVIWSRFQQEYRAPRVLAQVCGQHAAG